MCPPLPFDSTHPPSSTDDRAETTHDDDFPWEAGVFDAHCHPTDTMSSIDSIPDMGARIVTVMATRAQDQELVASVAAEKGIRTRERTHSSDATERVVPAFGWHPWFSYQLYDDTSVNKSSSHDPNSSSLEKEKAKHYKAVLVPPPSEDDDFIAGLPDPKPLSAFLSQTRDYLNKHPLALIGEVGLDKGFRLPNAWSDAEHSSRDETLTPGGREGRQLSPYRVNMDHQIRILKTQLALAGELGRACSVHGVQAHGVLYETLKGLWKGHEKRVMSKREQKMLAKGVNEDFSEDEGDGNGESGGKESGQGPKAVQPKPYPPRICLHSFSGPVQVLKQYTDDKKVPAKIFFSFSVCINFSTPSGEEKTPQVIRECPDDRILIESDLHTAGDLMDKMLAEMYRKVCEIKGWELRDGIERIRKNYEEFIFG